MLKKKHQRISSEQHSSWFGNSTAQLYARCIAQSTAVAEYVEPEAQDFNWVKEQLSKLQPDQ